MAHPPIIQIVGFKNAGKTTLTVRLIAELRSRGLCVGAVKHDAHEFEIDREGRDTYRHYAAGADAVAITSASRSALIRRAPASLEELASAMPEVGVVLAEGFKDAPFPKIALLRSEADAEPLLKLSGVFAAAAWFPYRHPTLPSFDIGDYAGLTDCVWQRLKGADR